MGKSDAGGGRVRGLPGVCSRNAVATRITTSTTATQSESVYTGLNTAQSEQHAWCFGQAHSWGVSCWVGMPSQLHEALLLLFRNRPELAAELLREALHVDLPAYSHAAIASAELTDIQPAEYRADLVVLLHDVTPVSGVIVEVQLRADEEKRYSWPVYVAGLRARLRRPVCLLVFTADDAVAKWASQPIDLGGGNRFVPLVLGPSGVPEVSDVERALEYPELAVLSAMSHGCNVNAQKAGRIGEAAMIASLGLDAERSKLYFDLVWNSLGVAARKELQGMNPEKYEYQSDFARRYVAEGRSEGKAEGKTEGKIDLLTKQLSLRFGSLGEKVLERLRSATSAEIDLFAERVLSAKTLGDVFGDR